MSQNKKIIAMLDELAQKSEEQGSFDIAIKLDTIAALVVTAGEDISENISSLAEDIKKYLPNLDTEQALNCARELFDKYCNETEAGEKESGYPNIFPLSNVPHKERREGPRPEDVPQGEPKFWK